jgi:hypothetical protein
MTGSSDALAEANEAERRREESEREADVNNVHGFFVARST